MRCAIYCRVSSAAQRDAHTIDAQLAALPEYAERQGWKVVARYQDDGHSAKAGSLETRRGLIRLLADATDGIFDVILVWDIDRLTRSEDLTERGAIMGAIQRAGVKLATISGGVLELDTAQGDMMASFMAIVAAEWNRKHRSRIKAGKVRAIAAGGKPAGPTPYGYRYDRWTRAWSIDEGEAGVIREICERVAKGEAMGDIADDFADRGVQRGKGGEWTTAWVWQLVRKRTYYADGQWTADKARGSFVTVPVIVEASLWAAAQKTLDAHSKRGLRRTYHEYLLQGLAVCECGEPMQIHSAHNKSATSPAWPARYVCKQTLRPARGSEPCTIAAWKFIIGTVDAEVWGRITDWLKSPQLMRAIAAGRRRAATGDAKLWQADLETAGAALEKLARAESGLLGRVRRGLVSDAAADRELEAIARERRGQERQLEAARRALGSTGAAVQAADALETAAAALRTAAKVATMAQRRAVVRGLLERPARLGGGGEILLSVGLRPVSAAGYSSDTQISLRDDLRFCVK
jgi:site-specific DNA recombinase